MAGSAYYSVITGESEWFQRSGSLAVLCSVIVEIQQTEKKQLKEETHVFISNKPVMMDIPVSIWIKILHWLAWFGIVIGTVVWGYGDLFITTNASLKK